MQITLIEPAWDGHVHLPGNAGLLQIAAAAFPTARLAYVGGAQQIDQLWALAPAAVRARTDGLAWQPVQDSNPVWRDVRRARARWAALPASCVQDADLLVLCSVTPTALQHCAAAGLASKTVGMLHGNAGDIGGWRSRNPLLRCWDLKRSLQRYVQQGGHAMVMEPRIAASLQAQHPWLAGRLLTVAHPLIEAEARALHAVTALGEPIRIGYAGLATAAKGFPQFLHIARALQALVPGRYSFHAHGPLHVSMVAQDQGVLNDRAGLPLERAAFIHALRQLDLLFLWHDEAYYQQAASGIFYDAVNQLLPLVCRRTPALQDLHDQGLELGWTFDDVESLIQQLAAADPHSLQQMATRAQADLAEHRKRLGLQARAAEFLRQLQVRRIGSASILSSLPIQA